jgi:sigma-B regulation protein RsbU (phosphoserine phosphatase)
VGGDYYDVLPFDGGCFIGIGDVAGHGLDAGLMMLMIQSMIATLVCRDPGASPRDIVCVLNDVLFDNIHNRLERYDHATLTLLRYEHCGKITFAGAHEEILVYRAAAQSCEVIRTPGTWIGGRSDIRRGTVENTLRLEQDDVMLLFTDGVTEIHNQRGEMFGLDRLVAEFERVHALPVRQITESLLVVFASWGVAQDDVTLLACRFGADSRPDVVDPT